MSRQLIKQGQGFRSEVYKCTQGHPTIGYGHKLVKGQYFTKVTVQQAQKMLDYDIKKAEEQIHSFYGKQVLNNMGQARRAVLIDMAYTLGSVRWPKLSKCIKQGDYEQAGEQILDSKYATQVKARAIRNSQIMKSGKLMTKEQAINRQEK